MTTLDDMLNELAPEDRAHVEARSKELIMEERALQTLRKAKKLSQSRMAELLNMRQDSVSRLERRSDLLISTLRSYIEAMGGSLKLMVNFPGQPSLFLDSLDMKKVKTAHKPLADYPSENCWAGHVKHQAANLNIAWAGSGNICVAPPGDMFTVVCYHPSHEQVHASERRGFPVRATLGAPPMTYSVKKAENPWCMSHEEA